MVFAGLLALAFHEGAPWFFYLPVVLGGSLLLFPLMKNRVDGLSLAPDYLTLGAWRAPQTVPVSEISKIEIVSWSDSTDMRVHLKSAGIVTAFPGDIPPREPFAAALARRGIPLEIS
jgi:hypothetical protein